MEGNYGMEYAKNHPKQQEFFYLDKMISEAGYPYFSTFWDALRPTSFDPDGGDPEKDINWDNFYFNIQISGAGMAFPIISIEIAEDGKLNLSDFRNAKGVKIKSEKQLQDLRIPYNGITSEQAMEIIDNFFKGL